MLVDSSGSMKPLASPTATQFFTQVCRRWPGLNLITRGSVRTLPSMLASSDCFACVVADVTAAIDHAVADAMTAAECAIAIRLSRDGARIGNRFAHGFCLNGDGAVARQPVRPIFIRLVQRLPDQQRAEAGAIDEQIAFDLRARIQANGFDEAGVVVREDVGDLALDALDAVALAELAQELRVEAGIDDGRRSSSRRGADARTCSRARL